jgi:hypothetical protein
MLPTTAAASAPPPLPAPAPGEPHAALFLALGYMRLPELLACWRVCRLLGEAVAGDTLLWRRVAVEPPLSNRVTDEILAKLTARAEGTLRSLHLVGCSRVSDAGLLRVVEQNPRVTEVLWDVSAAWLFPLRVSQTVNWRMSCMLGCGARLVFAVMPGVVVA